jgi:TetR/AcrR family transcriptional regulator
MMVIRRVLDSTDALTTEERILAAATEEFANNGFFGARTQAIADAAAVNKAMLHYYFRSKENLYSQVIKAAFERILQEVGRAWLGPDPMTKRVGMVIDSYMDSYEKNPGFLKIVLREVVDGGNRLKQAFMDSVEKRPNISGLTPQDIIERVSSELHLDMAETIHVIINLIGMCAISFVSPLLLESVVHYDISDFEAYLQQRRVAIKAMAVAYVAALSSGIHKE